MGRIKELKNEFNYQGQLQFIYSQQIHSIPKSWKHALIANLENIKNQDFEYFNTNFETFNA